MASYKRKYEELEDSDEEEPSFGRQILPVANLPQDFDEEPIDGLQYLFTVRRDARHLPHVTRVANPFETGIPQPSQTDNRVIPEHISLPSEEWLSLFETRFKNFRKNMNQPTIGVPFTPQNVHRRLMPEKKERDLWWGFLAGKPESDWNPQKMPKQTALQRRFSSLTDAPDPSSERKRQQSWQTNDEGEVELVLRVDPSESLPTPTGSPVLSEFGEPGPSTIASSAQEAIVCKPREPLPSFLRYIDERTALHLLMYFTHWINIHLQRPDPFSRPIETHARWIFVLLSKVEDPISADDMSLLRNLARACIALLKELLQTQVSHSKAEKTSSPDSCAGYMSVRSCWIIISTVAGVWAQRDLWMDAEDMLKSLGPAPEAKSLIA
ncbi:hypothetical protein D9615_000568 [Tricholomella constricta]|uniref:Uncharacterized protein n=1 Tax=Tricholomella constricta TaxID=117010 RepID=A0A8H5HRC1_9AGAR|nr:hypothetical protein D9615_000568 [Tricholomella constricta]